MASLVSSLSFTLALYFFLSYSWSRIPNFISFPPQNISWCISSRYNLFWLSQNGHFVGSGGEVGGSRLWRTSLWMSSHVHTALRTFVSGIGILYAWSYPLFLEEHDIFSFFQETFELVNCLHLYFVLFKVLS